MLLSCFQDSFGNKTVTLTLVGSKNDFPGSQVSAAHGNEPKQDSAMRASWPPLAQVPIEAVREEGAMTAVVTTLAWVGVQMSPVADAISLPFERIPMVSFRM